jgi:hypothetical protein
MIDLGFATAKPPQTSNEMITSVIPARKKKKASHACGHLRSDLPNGKWQRIRINKKNSRANREFLGLLDGQGKFQKKCPMPCQPVLDETGASGREPRSSRHQPNKPPPCLICPNSLSCLYVLGARRIRLTDALAMPCAMPLRSKKLVHRSRELRHTAGCGRPLRGISCYSTEDSFEIFRSLLLSPGATRHSPPVRLINTFPLPISFHFFCSQ